MMNFRTLEIRGTRDGIKRQPPAVDIMISGKKKLFFFTNGCVFFLVGKKNDNEERIGGEKKMTKKQKVVFAVVAAVLAVVAVIVLGTVLSYVCYHFIYGTRITSREGEAYHKLEGTGVYSPLAVFPSADMDTVSQDFYYQTRDEIFAATCQIYLENQYTREQYEAETERLRNLEFSYQDQTNMLYQDEKIIAALHMWQWQIGPTDMNMPSR